MPDDDTAKPVLPAFTPVPRKCDRSNGWKPHVQRAFIEALAETGSVTAACRRVGRAAHGAYQLRRHPEAGEFNAAWDAALDLGVRRIEDAAMERALYGVEVPVLSAGKQFGTRRVYNERLVMFMLRNRRPERYSEGGAHGLSAVDRMRLKRLKDSWRAEWAEEQRAAEPDIEEVRAEILRKVDAMQAAERQRWTPEEWEAHYALKKLREERERREQAAARPARTAPENPLLGARREAEDAAALMRLKSPELGWEADEDEAEVGTRDENAADDQE